MNPSPSDFPLDIETSKLKENLDKIRGRIERACEKSGRKASEVRLVAVTKTVGIDTCNRLLELGCRDLGENRPQVLWSKAAKVGVLVDPPGKLENQSPPPSETAAKVCWHFIGHLQRNKSARTVPLLSMLHSLDSERLADQIAKDLDALSVGEGKSAVRLRALLEINVTEDRSKTGLLPDDAVRVLDRFSQDAQWRSRIDLCGLMGMSSLLGNESQKIGRAHV